jgi:hypothetical protein
LTPKQQSPVGRDYNEICTGLELTF